LARAHTREAIEALVAALKRPKEAVPAAIALLDRGWGKPTVQINAQSEASVLHLIAAQAIGDQLVAELGEARPTASAEPLTIEALAALPLPEE
jgi:hypothetical protein